MTRLRQIASMYAYLTKVSCDEAERKIRKTKAGKAIAQGSPIYLYQQPTHNLSEIAEELPEELRKLFTNEAIRKSYAALEEEQEAVEEAKRTRRKQEDMILQECASKLLTEDDETDEEDMEDDDEAEMEDDD